MTRTYLIVDDSPVIRKTLEKLLANQGIPEEAIHQADDGTKAMDMLEEVQPDVVFTDIDMPGMDGEQAASLILQQDPDTKIIVISGLPKSDERVRRVVSMGAFEVIEKPVRSSDVLRLLNLLEQEEGGMGRIK